MGQRTNPIIVKEEQDGKIVFIEFVDGKMYKLQHPGNRIKLQWEKEYCNPVSGIDQEMFLDKAFEHCVIPEGHDFKPSIDDLKPKALEVWQRTLRRFLNGDFETLLAGTDESGPAPDAGSGKGKKPDKAESKG